MACPYFFPTEKSTSLYWPFPRRLPLGAGFCGACTAGGGRTTPSETELQEFCNVGYARQCGRIPTARRSDSVRFAVAKDGGNRLVLHYCCERDYGPVEHGQLQYDCSARIWPVGHADECIQRQAECYVLTYLEKRDRRD